MNIRAIMPVALVTTLVLAGCPQVEDPPAPMPPATHDSSPESAAAATATSDDEEERQRRAIAWLQSDLDQDGLSNEIELEYDLDPEDPTDGPDIDGDGVPNFEDNDVDGDGVLNETDPDIDADGIPNDRDDDVDGDAIPNEIDFDIDADGIRNRWDLDFDSDGEEDGETLDVPDALAEEYLHRARAALEDDDNDDDDDDAADRFEAYVEQLAKRAGEGDAKATEKYGRLLKQINSGGRRPVKPLSWEAKTIAEKLADRFKSSGVDKFEVELMLHELVFTREFSLDQDATDALDVLFRHATEIKDPKASGALDEWDTRIDGVVKLAGSFEDADLLACSEAVSKFAQLPGEGTPGEKVQAVGRLTKLLDEGTLTKMVGEVRKLAELPGGGTLEAKVDVVTLLAAAVGDPDWDALISGVEWLATEMDTWASASGQEWGWDEVVEALRNADLQDGIDWEVIEHVIDEVLEM